MQRRELAKRILRKVHKAFTYQEDIDRWGEEERWDHHADTVEAGGKFRDDCDGFAITCAELLLRAGSEPEETMLLICKVGGVGHMVCGVNDEGTTWILDNNSTWLKDWDDVPYDWMFAMTFDRKGEWRGVKNG